MSADWESWTPEQWAEHNRSLDGTRLIRNGIVTLRDGPPVDLAAFKPGGLWPVANPDEIQMWTPTGGEAA